MKIQKDLEYGKSVIYNTYQCYLIESIEHLKNDFQLSKTLDFPLGCKLVRGAYLITEKEHHGVNFPVHDSYENTNISYNCAIQLCLDQIEQGANLKVTMATHNMESIQLALNTISSKSLTTNSNVQFAQINGLGDHLSLSLVREGQSVLKLLPCGSIEEVLPWLGR